LTRSTTGCTVPRVNRYGFEMSYADREADASPIPASQADAATPDPARSQESGLHLEVIAGTAAGAVIRVEDELVIGRYATGAGQLSEDSEISRHHAHIAREASGNFAIEDLGSSNGTFVNGLRIATPQLLAEGDSIEVGATTFVVRSIVAPAAAAPADTRSGAGYAPTIFARVAPPEDAAPSGEDDTELRTPGPLTLTLEVDFEAREARIALGGGGEPVRMVFQDGRWQASQPGS
jgi:pSer/pThr/pTyr-binding forkhead associated (FHA) protein